MSLPVRTALRALSQQSTVYVLATVGRQIVIYLTLPIFTRIVSPNEFGLIATGTAVYALVNTISSAGLPAAIFRLYHEEKSEEPRAAVLSGGQILLISLAFVTAAVFVLLAALHVRFVLLPIRLALLVGALVIADTWIYFSQVVIRIQERSTLLSLTVVGQAIFQVGGAFAALILWQRDAAMYFAGFLAGSVITGLILLACGGRARFRWPGNAIVRELFAYGLPFLPVTGCLWAMRYSDRMFVSAFMTNADVAVYDIAARTGAIAGFFVPGIALAWPQFAFSRISDPDRDSIYRAALNVVTAVTCVIAIFVAAFRYQILHVFAPPRYQAGNTVVVLISVSQIAFAIYFVASTGLKLTKETGLIAWSAAGALLAHVLISAVLTPKFGITGPAIATLLSTSLLGFCMCFLGRRRANIVDVGGVLTLGAAAVLSGGMTLLGDVLPRGSLILNAGALLLMSSLAIIVLRESVGRRRQIAQ